MARVRTGRSTRIIRALLLSLVALLVVSLGTVVAVRDQSPTPEPPGMSDRALSTTRAATRDLQQQAKALAAILKDDGDTQQVLSTAVQTLQRHQRMLAPAATSGQTASAASPEPTAGQEPTAPDTAPSGTATATKTPEPDLPSLVKAMARSGRAALDDAADTTAPVARELAVAGTEQLTTAHALADAAGLPQPELPETPAGAVPAESHSCGTTEPPADSQKPSAGAQTSPASARDPAKGVARQQEVRALQATLTGLQRAVYAYETAVPRLSGKAASFAAERLQQHRRMLETGTRTLESACGRAPVAEPAYLLPDGFRQAPAAGLAAVEEDLVEMYEDLTGLSDGAARQWTLGALPRASLAARHWEQLP
ncbi:DUF4439 domain-containing protein [Arthrobacter castelli]|uniref:DUF4439 domain-containing protein n=1 Tax=Arthrobacter castelli TaxID=271431 RepID=UPI0004169CD8|nr:DUF4439 domain-containing protein [Arthrobacter castelli]